MQFSKRVNAIRLSATLFAILITATSAIFALSNEQVIHRFKGSHTDGYRPFASLVADARGHLYGTTFQGGDGPALCWQRLGFGCGTVFEMIPPTSSGGSWSEVLLHSFQGGADGGAPLYGLTLDETGNLYGTTDSTIFQLSPPGNPEGAWTETTLYTFGSDALAPTGNLSFDKAGNLYGTTYLPPGGAVYQLSPPSTPGGSWTFTILYNFAGQSDGAEPEGGVILDSTGALYGTTSSGGRTESCDVGYGCGTVFKLVPPAEQEGAWTEYTLYAFGSLPNDGRYPTDSLVFDATGNLYGATSDGGSNNCGDGYQCGTVFELSPPSDGKGFWTETILYNFAGGSDGSFPQANLTFDAHGKALYSVTADGGLAGGHCPVWPVFGCGTVFRLLPPATEGGAWTKQIVHRFGTGEPQDGIAPVAGLIRFGNAFYGTTEYGGGAASGTVFTFTAP